MGADTLDHKTCNDCTTILTDENWPQSRRRKRMYRCNECENKRTRRYRDENVEMRLWSSAKNRARIQGTPFNIEPSDVVIPSFCPVLGIPIDTSYTKRSDNSPSIDKAVPSLGYVRGNVVVISWRANRLKSDASVEELNRIASFYHQFVPPTGASHV